MAIRNPKSDDAKIITFLRSNMLAGHAKYLRNGRRYYNSTNFYPDSLRDHTPLGWIYQDYSHDTQAGVTPNVNIAKSAIDTLCAKASNQKVRPIFTPRDGSFSTRRSIQAIQNYFDDLFYNMNVNKLITKAFRYACIFDKGWLFINPITKKLEALPSWEVSVINSEAHYATEYTKALIRKKDFPTTLLKDYHIDPPQAKSKLYIDLELYIDATAHKIIILIDQQEYKQVQYTGSRAPVIPLYFNDPLIGQRTSALMDDLLPIQNQIDNVITKIKDASNSTPLNTIFYPDGSDLDITLLNNGAGNAIKYRPIPGMTQNPISVVTPNPLDMFYLNLYSIYKEDALNIAGISEMSATGQQPANITSGEQLKTMENIESNRFETQLAAIIRAYVQVAQLYIDVYDEEEEVLPKDKLRDEITWGDVKKQINNVTIQFTAASALSNDPEKQLELLKELSQLGYINQAKISDYIDLPDVRSAFNEAGAIIDAVDKVIQNVLEPKKDDPENYTIPIFVDYETLRDEIVSLQNQFYSMSGDHIEEIGRLQKLYMILEPLLEELAMQGQLDTQGEITQAGEDGFAAAGLIGGDNLTAMGNKDNTNIALSGDRPAQSGTPGVDPATAANPVSPGGVE